MGYLARGRSSGSSLCGTVPRRAGGDAHAAGLADRARNGSGTRLPRSGNGRCGLRLQHQGAGLTAVTGERRPGGAVAWRASRAVRRRLEARPESAPGSSPCASAPPRSAPSGPPREQRLAVARHSLSVIQVALARRLQLLYEQGDSDPLAVVLGASSVDEALSSLDSIDRLADQDRLVIEQTRRAKQLCDASCPHARRTRARARCAGRAGRTVDARARAGSKHPRFVPREPRRTGAASTPLRSPPGAAGICGRGEHPPPVVGRLGAAGDEPRAEPRGAVPSP